MRSERQRRAEIGRRRRYGRADSRRPRRSAARSFLRSVAQPIGVHLVGDAAGIERAVLTLFERAIADIDLRTHTGEHPRVGAVDVVPFIPIAAATMADCVALAKKVGAEVASAFGVPVFLYEERRRIRRARTSRTSAAASSRGSRRSCRSRNGRPTLDRRRRIPPPARASSARGCRSSPTTST
jgi:Glutamate formiminotransferase